MPPRFEGCGVTKVLGVVLIAGLLVCLCVRKGMAHGAYTLPDEQVSIGEITPEEMVSGFGASGRPAGEISNPMEQPACRAVLLRLIERVPPPRSRDREQVIRQLLDTVQDSKVEVRTQAILALGKILNSRSTVSLVSIVKKLRPKGKMAECALLAIGLSAQGGREGQQAVDVLLGWKCRSVGERDARSLGLALSGNPRVLPSILRELGSERSTGTMALAAGLLGDACAAPEVLKYTRNCKNRAERILALASLGGVGTEECITSLFRALRDQDHLVVRQAIISLGNLASTRDERISRTLSLIAEFHKDAGIRTCAVRALGFSPCEVSLAALARCAEQDEESVALSAVHAISSMNMDAAKDADMQADVCSVLRRSTLRYGSGELWSVSSLTLGLAGDQSAIPAIKRRLETTDDLVHRARAGFALGLLGDEGASEELKTLLGKCRTLNQIRFVSIGLRLCGEPSVDEMLIAKCRAGSAEYSRVASISALGSIRSGKAVPVLIDILRRERGSLPVRAAAARALGDILDQRGLSAKVRLLRLLDYCNLPPQLKEVIRWL